jgi:hypothetical protein
MTTTETKKHQATPGPARLPSSCSTTTAPPISKVSYIVLGYLITNSIPTVIVKSKSAE